MGLSVHNAQAVWEGLTGKKSPFVRTPKYNLTDKEQNWISNTYNQLKIPPTAYLEAILALVFNAMVVFSLITETYEMIAFHGMLAVGFTLVSITSFKSYLIKA
jgi:hypothetical protein